MNKYLLSAFFSLVACAVFSQDLITKTSGEEVVANVIEVGNTEIQFRKFGNPDGPIYIIKTADVLMIRYENGTKDVFNEVNEKAEVVPLGTGTAENLYLKGNSDALRYYRGYKPAATGTLVVGLISPIVGLVPAIITSATAPRDHNLNYPSIELMKNTDYYNGYTQKAKRIKAGKVWKNLGIAFGVNVVAIILIGASQ